MPSSDFANSMLSVNWNNINFVISEQILSNITNNLLHNKYLYTEIFLALV